MTIKDKEDGKRSLPVNADAVESAEEQQQPKAVVADWNGPRGFGFLRLEDGRRVFVHVSELCTHLNPGRNNFLAGGTNVIVGQLTKGPNGLKALEVQCEDCVKPAIWELQPTGEEILGVRELQPVCVNKPDEPLYKNPIQFEVVWAANEPFRLAKEKVFLWKGPLTAGFFKEFGSPESVEVIEGEKIAMQYPQGRKVVSAYDAAESGYWEVLPSGIWKRGKNEIRAEFVFQGIPLKMMRQVAIFDPDPRLTALFDQLPSKAQIEIIEELKPLVRSPEQVAKWRLDHHLAESDKERLAKINSDLVFLQMPGELYFSSGSQQVQQEVMASYGGESWGTGRQMDVMREYNFLVFGARKRERSGWSGNYDGGKKIVINKPTAEDTPEKIRQKLLEEKRGDRLQILERVRKFEHMPHERRLSDIDAEQWLERYNNYFQQRQDELLAQWDAEEAQKLQEMEKENRAYQLATDRLKEARDVHREVSERASRISINLQSLNDPDYGRIGDDSKEELDSATEQLLSYSGQVEELIAEQLKQRGEVALAVTKSKEDAVRNEREAMEAPAEPADWYLYGIDPERIEQFGRKRGEGFGQKLAGKHLYLPGIRPVVGMVFTGRTSRYRTKIESSGLTALQAFGLPEGVSKSSVELLAIVDKPDWMVKWTAFHDGVPYEYSIATAEGIAKLSSHWEGTYVFSTASRESAQKGGYDQWDGNGPSLDILKKVHGLGDNIVLFEEEESPAADVLEAGVKGFGGAVLEVLADQAEIAEPVAESHDKTPEVQFTDKGKRYVQCTCGYMDRIAKTDYEKYHHGEEVRLNCGGCKGGGVLKK